MSSDAFQDFTLTVNNPEDMKQSLFRKLYDFLTRLLNGRIGFTDTNLGINVTHEDISMLSNTLFKELPKRYEVFLSSMLVSKSMVVEQASLPADIVTHAENMYLLLRCCMVCLNFLVHWQRNVLEKGHIILMILKVSLCLVSAKDGKAIDFKKLISSECKHGKCESTTLFSEGFVASFDCQELSDAGLPFMCAMLEVFADEVLEHRRLGIVLKLIDSTSSMKFFSLQRGGHGHMQIVMELIFACFSVALSEGKAIENLLKNLFNIDRKHFRSPEICLTAAMSLLSSDLPSLPKHLQAHLMLLVSDVIGISTESETMRPVSGLINYYLLAFETSIFYSKHMLHLQMGGRPTVCMVSVESSPFINEDQESVGICILPGTLKRFFDFTMKTNDWWKLHARGSFFQSKLDLVDSAYSFIVANKVHLDLSCANEIISILKTLVMIASGDDYTTLDINMVSSLSDLCFLASALKLMGSSLFQVVRHLKNQDKLNDQYDALKNLLDCSNEFSLSLPIQMYVCHIMKAAPMKHKESKAMFFHFLGLLNLSFISGLDFIVKGCIWNLMALLNLFVFEEGNLDVLRPLMDSRSEVCSTCLTPRVQVVRATNPARKIAAKFQELRAQCMRYCVKSTVGKDIIVGEDDMEETCSSALVPDRMACDSGGGKKAKEKFLESLFETKTTSDYDDLVDFIDCEPEMDYCKWLKNRFSYRHFRGDILSQGKYRRKKTLKVLLE